MPVVAVPVIQLDCILMLFRKKLSLPDLALILMFLQLIFQAFDIFN